MFDDLLLSWVFTRRALHRWVFLRARLHRELAQGEEQKQPHDQPAPPDHDSHPQQIPEDGNMAMEVEPVDVWILDHPRGLRSLVSCANGQRKHPLPQHSAAAAARPNTRSVTADFKQTSAAGEMISNILFLQENTGGWLRQWGLYFSLPSWLWQ